MEHPKKKKSKPKKRDMKPKGSPVKLINSKGAQQAPRTVMGDEVEKVNKKRSSRNRGRKSTGTL